MSDLAWMSLANCLGTDPEAFFPDGGGRPSKQVRATCANCLVQAECLDFALEHEERGVWAGTSEADRERILGRRLSRTTGEAA